MTTASLYRALTNDRIYTYTSTDLAEGRAAVYLLEDEPMSGPQRRLRIRIRRLYERALNLLVKENARGQSWARDFARDIHTKYEGLDQALENANLVNLREAVEIMIELLCNFKPGLEIKTHKRYRLQCKVYERNRSRRVCMEAERDLILKELADINLE